MRLPQCHLSARNAGKRTFMAAVITARVAAMVIERAIVGAGRKAITSKRFRRQSFVRELGNFLLFEGLSDG
jgi:hypothetical protein